VGKAKRLKKVNAGCASHKKKKNKIQKKLKEGKRRWGADGGEKAQDFQRTES